MSGEAPEQHGQVWLIGNTGVGKTAVGRLLADALGRHFIDLDERIERRAGRRIPEIFREDGEAGFRALEAQALGELAESGGDEVIATGAGAACQPGAIERMRTSGLVVWLRAGVDTVLHRIDLASRPLLAGAADPRGRLLELEAARRVWYRRADLALERGEEDAYATAMSLARSHLPRFGPGSFACPPLPEGGIELEVPLGERAYPIFVDPGGAAGHAGDPAERLAARLARRIPPISVGSGSPVYYGSQPIAVITDENVARLHAPRYVAALQQRGYRVVQAIVPAGEAAKTLAQVERVAEELVRGGLHRRSAVVAIGGGAVGDLAGFVASVVLRGVPVVQVPTTMLAQVDASVGGKTAVNLPSGKNLIGSFHQPLLVYIDLSTLATLSPRDRASGLAEVAKHALLEGGAHLDLLEARAEDARAGDPKLLAQLVAASCRLKASVVALDEREQDGSGGRVLLNLGHTVGHTLEAASLAAAGEDVEAVLRHGEAVALGLIAMARVSRSLGHADLEGRITSLLDRLGLPTDLDRRVSSETMKRLSVDKKRTGLGVPFVVLERPGRAYVHEFEFMDDFHLDLLLLGD